MDSKWKMGGRKIKIIASASLGNLQIFECWEYKEAKRVQCKYVNVALLKQAGIIKAINQTKKAEQYLNSDEGLKFFDETPHTPLIY